MDELENLLQSIKSLKEMSVADQQKVYKRYETMQACGVAKDNNEVFLHQQNINVQVLECDLSKKDLQGAFEERGIKYDDKYEGRVKLYKASDETVDSAGDIIRQTGWDFSRYKTNPVFAYCHDYYILPIGTAIKWFVKDGALWIYNMFALPEANPWAENCLQMVNGKMLNGNSVGFIPKKIMYVEDEKERQQLGLGKYGVIFEKSMLLEDSACALGCNPSALVQDSIAEAMQKGIISKDSLERILKDDSAVNIPESLKISVDRAMVMCNKSIASIPPVAPVGGTGESKKTVADSFDFENSFKTVNDSISALTKSVEIICTEFKTIKADMADIRDKASLLGKDGNSPESNTDNSEDLYSLMTGIKEISQTVDNIIKGK